MSSPYVTVLLPAFNSALYVGAAIESILSQTHSDLELLIIEDGSGDKTAEVVSSYKDSRIRVIQNDGNQGLIYSLNLGLAEASGDFLARMDADDVCEPDRLAVQVSFLEANADVGICGSWIRQFRENHEAILRLPSSHEQMTAMMPFDSPIAHPSVMMRMEMIRNAGLKYDPAHYTVEDFGFWMRAAFHFRLANIPSALLRYRLNPTGVTASVHESEEKLARRRTAFGLLFRELFEQHEFKATEDELRLHVDLQSPRSSRQIDCEAAEAWFSRLWSESRNWKGFDRHYFGRVIAKKRAHFYSCKTQEGPGVFASFLKSPLPAPGLIDQAKLAVKCMLRRDSFA